MPKCTCLYCGQDRKHEARGLCGRCYQVVQQTGEMDQYPTRLRTLGEWIALIDTSDPDRCWPWPGPMGNKGYGSFGGPAHRAVYSAMIGPIEDGKHIDHVCHNVSGCEGGLTCPHRRCVNWVNHLRPTTARVNLLSSPNTVNSINTAKDHCPQDHPYNETNTVRRRGRRFCRECDRQRANRYYHANIQKVRAKAREYQRRRRTAPVSAEGVPQA